MDSISTKLNTRLRSHICGVDLTSVSRVPIDRFEQTALPHIGVIELVSAEDFAQLYDALYRRMFHGGEREKSELIVQRLQQEFAGARQGLAPYRVIGIRDHAGQPIAGAQFSVLFLPESRCAVPYLQYIYTRPENRRQDMSELLHTLVLAVTTADARERNERFGNAFEVPFTLFETEPPCHGIDERQRAIAEQRSRIHTKSGSLALMLRRKSDGRLMTAHVQPGLDEPGDPPVILIWALRATPAADLLLRDRNLGEALIAAYYRSLRDEGFPEQNIAVAERIVDLRYKQGCEFCLMPLADVTTEMYVDVD